MDNQSANQEYHMSKNETTRLLPHHQSTDLGHGGSQGDRMVSARGRSKIGLLFTAACAVILSCELFLRNKPMSTFDLELQVKSDKPFSLSHNVEHLIGKNHHQGLHHHHFRNDDNTTYLSRWVQQPPHVRCEHVMELFHQRDAGTNPLDLEMRYLAQSVDANVFFRATANIFWTDFVKRVWGDNFTSQFLLHNDPDSDDSKQQDNDDPENRQKLGGVPLTRKSVWTWVTGDQHLSNFGGTYVRHVTYMFLHLPCSQLNQMTHSIYVANVWGSLEESSRCRGFRCE
jgi:hypothetical protein